MGFAIFFNKLSRFKFQHVTLCKYLTFLNLDIYHNASSLAANVPNIHQYLTHLEEEYKELQNKGLVNERYNYLSPIIEILKRKKQFDEEMKLLSELAFDKDKEMSVLAKDEKKIYLEQIEKLDCDLYELLLPTEQEPLRDIALEITAGVGGQEAMLFADELLQMYQNYSMYKQWEWSPIEMDKSDIGGLRHASVFISGRSVHSTLMQESGVHRVQRIPSTEKSGRLHTSTVTVAVLPQPTDIEIAIKDKDLKIETKRASGAGGQHVNKTDSAVRITHLPTGIAVESQAERQQLKNKTIAMQKLRMKLYQIQLDEQMRKTVTSRKQQVGTSMRSEKVRTYNFNQDRVTDHRLGETVHNIQGFISGGTQLDTVVQKLLQQERIKNLNSIINSELNR